MVCFFFVVLFESRLVHQVQSYAQLQSVNDQIKKSQAIVVLEMPSSLRFFLSNFFPLT